jgi:hypothetical protein
VRPPLTDVVDTSPPHIGQNDFQRSPAMALLHLELHFPVLTLATPADLTMTAPTALGAALAPGGGGVSRV